MLILLCLAIPSFQLLTAQYNPPREPELTVKATGYQWYWGYEYQPAQTVAAASSAAAGTPANPAEPAAEPVSFLSYPIPTTRVPRPERKTAAPIRVFWPSTTRWSCR